MAEAIMRERGREARAATKDAAFTAWLSGAGDKKSWGDFCAYLGIEAKAKRTKEQTQAEIKRAHEAYDRVINAMNRGKK